MAEHKLLSTIFKLINSLVALRNEGKGLSAIKDKRVDSLKDLRNCKKLSKLLKLNPRTSKPEAAKEEIADVIIGYLSDDHFIKKEVFTQLMSDWNKDLNILLNFVVLIITIGYRLTLIPKNISKSRRTEVIQDLDFINSYYDLALNNCINALNKKEVHTLIHFNNDRMFALLFHILS